MLCCRYHVVGHSHATLPLSHRVPLSCCPASVTVPGHGHAMVTLRCHSHATTPLSCSLTLMLPCRCHSIWPLTHYIATSCCMPLSHSCHCHVSLRLPCYFATVALCYCTFCHFQAALPMSCHLAAAALLCRFSCCIATILQFAIFMWPGCCHAVGLLSH